MVAEPVVQITKGAERISADGTTIDPQIEDAVRQRLMSVAAAFAGR
jgi:hypothetical protein